jgi:hypothetical protein
VSNETRGTFRTRGLLSVFLAVSFYYNAVLTNLNTNIYLTIRNYEKINKIKMVGGGGGAAPAAIVAPAAAGDGAGAAPTAPPAAGAAIWLLLLAAPATPPPALLPLPLCACTRSLLLVLWCDGGRRWDGSDNVVMGVGL